MATTVCPLRLLDPETEAFVQWYVQVANFGPMNGIPMGVREWPRKGGVLRQDAKVVEAVNLLTNEWPYLPKQREPARAAKPPMPAKRGRRR